MVEVDGWFRPCDGGECVEVRRNEYGMILFRSSESRWKEAMLTEAEWKQFLGDVKNGAFDDDL